MKKIKILIMDVDGTLTDGNIYITVNGEFMKSFNVKDGYGIKHVLPEYGIIPVIITGRESLIVKKRCQELDIQYFYQNIKNKSEKMHELLSLLDINIDEVAYVGDDVNDIDCMKEVGFSACPADAVVEVKNIANFVCKNKGGHGAVREVIDLILKLYQ